MHGRWLRLYVSHTWRIMHCNPKQIPGDDGESYTVPEVRENKSCTRPHDFFIQKTYTNIHWLGVCRHTTNKTSEGRLSCNVLKHG